MAYRYKPCPYSKEEFEKMIEGKNIRQSALTIGVTQKRISDWMDDFKIPKLQGSAKNIELTDYQKQVIYGSLLGDGSLSKTKNTVYYTETHSSKQLDYLLWKKEVLKEIVGKSFRYLEDSDTYVFSTKTNKYLQEIFSKFYVENGRKKVRTLPKDLYDNLTPLSLAILYMDDGYLGGRNKNQAFIYTSGYTLEENERFSKILWEKFGIESNVIVKKDNKRNKEYPYIYIKTTSFEGFIEVIRPHIIPNLSYKLPY